MALCKTCGAHISDAANFCDTCGARIARPTPAQPEQPEVAFPEAQSAEQTEEPLYENDQTRSWAEQWLENAPPVQEAEPLFDEPQAPLSKKEQKQAQRAARKAEKQARKAQRAREDAALDEPEAGDAPLFDAEDEPIYDDELDEMPPRKNRGVAVTLIVALLLILAIAIAVFGLPALRTANSPLLGTWTAVSGDYAGYSYPITEMLDGSLTLTLQKGGKATISVRDYTEQARWMPDENGARIWGSRVFSTLAGTEAALQGEYGATGVTILMQKQ